MKRTILAFLISFIIAPINVYAANQLYLDCPSEITKNSEFSCLLKGTSDEEITAFSAKLQCQGDISLVSFTNVNKWQGDGDSGNIDLYLADPVVGEFDIGIVKFRNHGLASMGIDIDSIFFYNGSVTTEVTMSNIIIKLRDDNYIIPKDDELSLLKDLTITNYDLNFNEKVSEYTLKIKDETTLDINPIMKDYHSRYEIINNHDLTNGSKISIVVTSDQGNSNYLINIEKSDVVDEKKNFKNYSYIFIIIIVILIVVNILRIIKKSKNNC